VIEQRDDHRRLEAVVGGQLEDGVGAVLVHAVEAEQVRHPLAIDREIGPDHDHGAGRAHVHTLVAAVEPREVASQRGDPRQPEVAERHRLRVLAEAVAGDDRVRVLPRQPEQHRAQAVHAAHDGQQLLALQDVDADGGEIAGAARQVQPPPDVLAERTDQILLAGVQPAADLATRVADARTLLVPERAEDLRAHVARHQAPLDEHHAVGLVERVHDVLHRLRAARVE
jgi:hypothetical protein